MRGAGLALAAVLTATVAGAAPAPPGALACAGCHAAAPAGAAPPALLGRPAGELAQMMRDFRSGTLAGTIMPRLSRGFDEAEIEAIAQWLATQRAP